MPRSSSIVAVETVHESQSLQHKGLKPGVNEKVAVLTLMAKPIRS